MYLDKISLENLNNFLNNWHILYKHFLKDKCFQTLATFEIITKLIKNNIQMNNSSNVNHPNIFNFIQMKFDKQYVTCHCFVKLNYLFIQKNNSD